MSAAPPILMMQNHYQLTLSSRRLIAPMAFTRQGVVCLRERIFGVAIAAKRGRAP